MIKQPWLAVISGILFLVIVGFVVQRVIFLQSAEKATGTVIKVSSYNGRCGGGRRRRSYSCTKFNADIQFGASNRQYYTFNVSTGSSRGHDKSISLSRLKLQSRVPVIYNPKDPNEVFEDTLWGVWGTPIMIFFGQIASFIASFFDKRKGRY